MTHLQVQRAEVGATPTCGRSGVAFGASLSRVEVETPLAGDGGSSEMLGVYVGDGDQHIDYRSIQDHVGSRTVERPAVQGRDERRVATRSTPAP